jgi:hypothetical protein
LRHSHGDTQELWQAPGHYFLTHEKAEAATFLSLTIAFGWDAYLISNPTWTKIFLSHDGWMRIALPEDEKRIFESMEQSGLSYERI